MPYYFFFLGSSYISFERSFISIGKEGNCMEDLIDQNVDFTVVTLYAPCIVLQYVRI